MFKALGRSILLQGLKIITSGKFIASVVAIVSSLIDKEATGRQKKEVAIQELKEQGADFSSTIVNMAIEVGVNIVKEKAGDEVAALVKQAGTVLTKSIDTKINEVVKRDADIAVTLEKAKVPKEVIAKVLN